VDGRSRFLFDGPVGWLPEFVLLVVFIWSLESIRRWNKAGFFLYIGGCALALTFNAYELVMASQSIQSKLLGPPIYQ
jgi:hypothetical protein